MVYFLNGRIWVFIIGILSCGLALAQTQAEKTNTESRAKESKPSKILDIDLRYYTGNEAVATKAKDGISTNSKATQTRGLGIKFGYLVNKSAKIDLGIRRTEARYKDLENVTPDSTKNQSLDTSLHYVSKLNENLSVGGGLFMYRRKASDTTPVVISNVASYGPSAVVQSTFGITDGLTSEVNGQLDMPTYFKEGSKKTGAHAYGYNVEIDAGMYFSVVHWQTVGLSVNYRMNRDQFYGANEQGGTDSSSSLSAFSIPVTLRIKI